MDVFQPRPWTLLIRKILDSWVQPGQGTEGIVRGTSLEHSSIHWLPKFLLSTHCVLGHDLGAGTDRQKALLSQRGQSPCLNSNQCCKVHKKQGGHREGCGGGERRHHLSRQEMDWREWKPIPGRRKSKWPCGGGSVWEGEGQGE